MGKTRSCRRTKDENKIHDKAVKMRKMTDEQLVHYVEDRAEKARSEGFNQARRNVPDISPEEILKDIAAIKGIGATKIQEIGAVLSKYIPAKASK